MPDERVVKIADSVKKLKEVIAAAKEVGKEIEKEKEKEKERVGK